MSNSLDDIAGLAILIGIIHLPLLGCFTVNRHRRMSITTWLACGVSAAVLYCGLQFWAEANAEDSDVDIIYFYASCVLALGIVCYYLILRAIVLVIVASFGKQKDR